MQKKSMKALQGISKIFPIVSADLSDLDGFKMNQTDDLNEDVMEWVSAIKSPMKLEADVKGVWSKD